MIRKIISINEEKCNGCGLCVNACHEGALKIIDGKAKLISDTYCDGLGNCLPQCPTGAIEIIEREAGIFDEEAVKKHLQENNSDHADKADESAAANVRNEAPVAHFSGCPGSRARVIAKRDDSNRKAAEAVTGSASTAGQRAESQLGQWPCQIKLVHPNAPYFENADLLVAADCTAFAYANIHQDFMRNRITIIGCPKLDDTDYSEKLALILAGNNIKSITVLRMEVPCCGRLVNAVKSAMLTSGKLVPWNVITVGIDGNITE